MSALTRLSLKYRTVTLLMVGLLLAGGIFAATSLRQELFPSLEVPYLVVSATEPGAGPNVVATDVAGPIEDAVSATEGVRHVSSTSLEGVAIVVAEYEFGADMEARQREVREALAAGVLPDGVGAPQVERISPDSFPVYSVAVSGSDEAQLDSFVRDTLEPAVATVQGVGDVSLAGGSTEVVSVVVDPERLAAAGLSIGDVTTSLQSANLSVPVGGVASDGIQFPVRVLTSASDLEQVKKVAVTPSQPLPGANPVPLDAVADVEIVEGGSGSTISRVDGRPAITLDVVKAQDANTVETVDAIEQAIEDVTIPDGIAIDEVVNQAPEIRQGVSDLARDAVIGAILAIIMILIFLRSVRATFVSGITIPLSLLVAFILMMVDGITLNILTLGALSVAAGRVIDDAIVVIENIHRLMDEEGMPRSEAVLQGTTQMVPAITASTITTVAVFLPLAFVAGLVGQVFVGFALTVTFALLASLLVAVTVVPVLAQTFLKPHTGGKAGAGDREEMWLRSLYRRPLVWALKHRGVVVATAGILLVGSMALLTTVPTTLFPSSETKALQASLDAPAGTSLASTSEMVADVEGGIGRLVGVESFTTVVGTSTDAFSALQSGAGGSSSATLTVDLTEDADADALTAEIENLAAEAGLAGAVSPMGGDAGPLSSNLSLQVTGSDFEQVALASEQVSQRIGLVDGIEDVTTNLAADRPEIVVDVDQSASAAAGLSPAALADGLRATLSPTPATAVFVDGELRQVIVATDPEALSSPEALADLPILPGLRLGDIAEVEEASSPTAVTGYDGERSVEVSAVITAEDVGKVNTEVGAAVDEIDLPPGVDTTLGGAAELMSESFASLGVAMLIAVALVYLAMVVTFGSLLTPFVILLSLPLAAIGAFTALAVTGRELGLPAMLGLLMLIGIVVTNAIVMLDRVERLKRDGKSTFEALVEGASTRLRPILMTAFVTILALTPLALGLSEGALLSASLATVVIGGLFSATFLTLFVIPAIYSLFDGLRRRFSRGERVVSMKTPTRTDVKSVPVGDSL